MFYESDELPALFYSTVFINFETEKSCISFLSDIKLIPKKNVAIACPQCSSSMVAVNQEIAWLWKCTKETCSGSVNPLQNTFFEDIELSPLYVLALILNFVDKRLIWQALDHVGSQYWFRTKKDLSEETVKQVYAKCRRVCEIVMSQEYERMIGPYSSTLYLMYLKRILNVNSVSRARKGCEFLNDVAVVYPGYGKTGLTYKKLPTPSSADV